LTGQQYKASRAGGDVMREGQFEPFAFVPLQPTHMNKRSGKFKAERALRSMITPSQKGNRVGQKLNRKARKSKKMKRAASIVK